MKNDANYLTDVKDQYEDLPYPPRDPEEEKVRLLKTSLDLLDLINHLGYKGEQTFKNGFRCLVAGGGTGDSVIHLAEQLKGFDNAEIIHLDLSNASMDICKERAKVRGLTNITWIQASLLDVDKLDLGKFDFINCCGVLHHLESPEDGLKALESVLKDDGIMGIMVYGRYGRLAVYPLQEMLRNLNLNTANKQEQIDNCKEALNLLGPNHFSNRINSLWRNEQHVLGDAGIYDLLLHSQDRAYNTHEIYDWVEGCNLNLLHISSGTSIGTVYYDVKNYIPKGELLDKVLELPIKNQQTVAELMNGSIDRHYFYVGKKTVEKHTASFEDTNLIPFFTPGKTLQEDLCKNIKDNLKGGKVTLNQEEITATLLATEETLALVSFMDGDTDIKTILNRAEKKLKKKNIKVSNQSLQKIFSDLYRDLYIMGAALLRSKEAKQLNFKGQNQQ